MDHGPYIKLQPMRSFYLFFVMIATLLACTPKNKIPKDVLPLPKMQEVMWDMISAGEFVNGYAVRDSVDRFKASAQWYGRVLQVHKITREQFDKSYLYYRQHPELMKTILDTLNKREQNPIEEPAPPADAEKQPDTIKPLTIDTPAVSAGRPSDIYKRIDSAKRAKKPKPAQ